MFWDKKSDQQKDYSKKKKSILKKIEELFGVEKGTLSKSHRDMDVPVKVILNAKRTSQDITSFFKILDFSSSPSNLEKLKSLFREFEKTDRS